MDPITIAFAKKSLIAKVFFFKLILLETEDYP